MKLKTLEELKQVAEVRPPLTRDRMSKRQRLACWAEVLELAPQRRPVLLVTHDPLRKSVVSIARP